MRRGWLAALCALGGSLAAPEPAAAQAPASKGVIRDCTFKETVSQICVDLSVRLRDGRAGSGPTLSRGEEAALSCILDAVKSLNYPGGTPNSFFASEVIELGEDDAPSARECFKLTDMVEGNAKWRKPAEERRKRALWAKEMQQRVANTFRTKCGVEASLDGFSLTKLSVERTSNDKRVFYDGKDGTGSHITVYCGGKIVSRFPGGGSSTRVASTWSGQAKAMDQMECLQRCAHKKAACLENGGNITVTACRRACEPECGR